MHSFEIKLWDEGNAPYSTLDGEASNVPEGFLALGDNVMRGYLASGDKPLPAVVVFPGGGYWGRARHEADPIAQYFLSQGMNAFVVEYRVKPHRHPAPLADAQRAIKLIRKNAKAWNVDTDRIVAVGFSAGGHLAASCGVLDDVTREREGADEIDEMCARPNGMILCYPVIHMFDDFGHPGSARNLCGNDVSDEMREYLSLENRVSADTPPAFIWHTSDDATVNVKNSLVFGERLRDNGVPFEMHVYPRGKHGLGIGLNNAELPYLTELAAEWIWRNV